MKRDTFTNASIDGLSYSGEKIKPCPCGATPVSLDIEIIDPNYYRIMGDCCGFWEIEIKGNPEHVLKEWNRAPRV